MSPRSPRRPPNPAERAHGVRAFVAGVLAALSGAAAGHLVAALVAPASSPVLAVGTAVINATPTPVKELAVRELGTSDKPVLVTSVLVVTLVLAGVAGLLTRIRFVVGAGLLLALVAAAAVAAIIQPAAGPADLVPGAVTAVAGVGVLWLLTRPHRVSTPAGASGRRGFLIAAAGTAVAAAGLAAVGERIVRARTRLSDIALPRPRQPLPALPTGLEHTYAGISPLRTSSSRFYRVDTNLQVPVVDQDSWRLVVDGDVRRRLSYTFKDLLGMDLVERDITLTCVSNEVGGPYVSAARWLGVPLRQVLEPAGVGSGADQILSTAVDGFTISTPLDVALDGRDTLIAVGMNGEPLPREHGFPCRLVTPGLYGFVGSTKWLSRLTLTTYAGHESYWTRRQWATDAPIKLSSRIDTPRPFGATRAGEVIVGGVAWGQPDGVAAVEVRLDDGPWQQAELGPDVDNDYWRQWYYPWQADPGSHTIAVRATSKRGEVQTARRTTPFPAGSSGLHTLVLTVS